MPTDPDSYGAVIARNFVAARARCRLKQADVAVRMRALGFSWHPQTVGEVEKGNRRLTAEEILGSALALETSIGSLMDPTRDDEVIRLPSGHPLPVGSVQRLVRHFNDGAVVWTGDTPDIDSTWGPGRPGFPQKPDAGVRMEPISEFGADHDAMTARNDRIARARGGYQPPALPPNRGEPE